MSAVLINTNIYSHAMRGDAEIIKALQQAAHIGITAISIGELLSGFKAVNKEQVVDCIGRCEWAYKSAPHEMA